MADPSAATELEPPADSPEAAAKRWSTEFRAARDEVRDWHDTADKCDERYRDDTRANDDGDTLNLYAAGVDLKEATLYGNTPVVDVGRRHNDQDDDDARVAGDLLERLLNGDLERDEEEFPRAIGFALKDWLIAGLGDLWFRYEAETQKVPGKPAQLAPDGRELAPAVPATTKVVDEDVCCDYVYWKDSLHSPCRVFSDMRWRARRTLLSKKGFEKKFGPDERPPFAIGGDDKDKTIPKTPWARVALWQIWDKEAECIWFYVEDHPRVLVPLDMQDQAGPDGSIPDPLGIPGFWPFPEPVVDGVTNSKFVPRPSWARSQDQYRAVDDETTRIGILRDAVSVRGVYDQTVGELSGLLDNKSENKMVPATNYKALAEKGGIAACVAWLPLEAITAALQVLRDLRREDIELLYQVDGTSDIMRGQATEGGATATEQAIKAKYGSIRGDKGQKRFTRFCSDAQKIRGYIVCKHFSPETIARRANARGLPKEDLARVPAALAILKSDASRFRISVKAETVSLTDFAANRQESMDVLNAIGTVQKMMQGVPPQLMPGVLRLAQVALARVKGGDAYEAALDALVEQAEQMLAQQAQTPPQPNPQVQVAQIKAQAETGKAQADMAQTRMDMERATMEHAHSMQQLEAETRAEAMSAVLGPQNGAPV